MQNLWADEDNNVEIAPEATTRVEKTGTMRPSSRALTEQRVVSALRAWLLTDYIAPYCRSLAATRIFRRCFLIDGLGYIKGGKSDSRASQADKSAVGAINRPLRGDMSAVGATGRADESAAGATGRADESAAGATGRADEWAAGATGRADESAVGAIERADESAVGAIGRADESAVGAINRPLRGLFDEESQLSLERASNHKKASVSPVPQILQPVAALAQELTRESKPITLQALLLDGGRRRRNQPESSFLLPKESSVIAAGWLDVAPPLLQAVEQSAAVFLLNPLRGMTQGHVVPFFTADDFAPLFQRTAPTELCLLLSHAEMQEVFLPALRAPTGAAAFTTLLRSDRWKALLAKDEEPGRVIDDLIHLWRTALQPHFLAVQRVTFPMIIGPATVEETPFSLLFATRRQDSLFDMNDAVCRYRSRLETESHRGLLNEAWFATQQQERLAAHMRDLREQTLRLGRAQSPRRWPDLRQQLLLTNFGAFTTRDYDETIARLLEEGEVRCEWRARAVASENEAKRIPGNDDVLLWKEKKRRY